MLKMHAETIDRLNLLQAINVHSLYREFWNLFRPYSCIFKSFSRNEKVHVAFIEAIANFGIIEPTMHKI